MDARRAQDLLKHITQDEDYGLKAMQKASLAECISMVNNVLPECQKKAYEDGNDNESKVVHPPYADTTEPSIDLHIEHFDHTR